MQWKRKFTGKVINKAQETSPTFDHVAFFRSNAESKFSSSKTFLLWITRWDLKVCSVGAVLHSHKVKYLLSTTNSKLTVHLLQIMTANCIFLHRHVQHQWFSVHWLKLLSPTLSCEPLSSAPLFKGRQKYDSLKCKFCSKQQSWTSSNTVIPPGEFSNTSRAYKKFSHCTFSFAPPVKGIDLKQRFRQKDTLE